MKISRFTLINAAIIFCFFHSLQAVIVDVEKDFAAYQKSFDAAAKSFDAALKNYIIGGLPKNVTSYEQNIWAKIQPSIDEMENSLKSMYAMIKKISVKLRNKVPTYKSKLIDRLKNEQYALKVASFIDANSPSEASLAIQTKDFKIYKKSLANQLKAVNAQVLSLRKAKKTITNSMFNAQSSVVQDLELLQKIASLRAVPNLFSVMFNHMKDLYCQIGSEIRSDITKNLEERLKN